MVEMEGGWGNEGDEIRQLQDQIMQHHKKHPLKSFYTKDSPGNKRKRPNNGTDNQGTDGGAGGVNPTNFAELEAHGYEVEPRAEEVGDGKGGVMIPLPGSEVWQPHSTHQLR